MKKACITGGCGFIGSHLTKNLIDNGWQVTVVDDLSTGSIDSLTGKGLKCRVVLPQLTDRFLENVALQNDEVLIITGDFADINVLKHLATAGYTHVFHLAANPRVEESVIHPAATTDNNLQKSVELLWACCQTSCKLQRFVFASSSAVYGDIKRIPTPENSKKRPNSPYGLQKLCVEKFMRQFHQLYNLDCVALRFANVYGPGATGATAYSTAIAAWCRNLSEGRPLRSDGSGNQKRDMIYVGDVVEALRVCAEKPAKPKFRAVNVGTEVCISNNEILRMLREKVGDFEIENANKRHGDVLITCLQTTKIRNMTGWAAKVDISAGLEKTLQWWKLIPQR